MKKTTIILIDNHEWKIFNALQSIKNSLELLQFGKLEFIIATQQATDDLLQQIKPFKEFNVQIVSCEWRPKTKALNVAVAQAKNEFICVINENTIIFKGFFEKMIEWLNDPLIWIVCPRFMQWKDARKGLLYYWKRTLIRIVSCLENPTWQRCFQFRCNYTIGKIIFSKTRSLNGDWI